MRYVCALYRQFRLRSVSHTSCFGTGFPQTWYQWRHTINPLSNAGYRVIVPDYRGAGNSQAPPSNAGFAGGKGGGYTKVVMADDLRQLVKDHLGIKEKIHVVGHDIGV